MSDMKQRLDQVMVQRGLAASRSQAEDHIKRGFVVVDGRVITKAGFLVGAEQVVRVTPKATFVSRAGEKLYSVIEELQLNFRGKTVLDVGSSTGGFTQVALQQGADKVIAVDVGTEQLHASLRDDERIELHEKTDIRSFRTTTPIDMVVADVSFISLRDILPSVLSLVSDAAELVVMVKPQFEAGATNLKHKGVIKNDRMRREILKSFESWAQQYFMIEAKADSRVAGAKGNLERFYKLRRLQH